MRSKRIWRPALVGLVAIGVFAVACGGGHLVFNVDVYSFIKGTGQDTVPYVIPPNSSNAVASSTPQHVNTPGAGSSLVDSVLVFATLNLKDSVGTGSIGLQLFIAPDSAGTYSPSAAALTLAPVTVSPGPPVADTIRGRLLASAESLFTNSHLWFRVAAQGSNASLTTPVIGKMVLTSAILTVWLNAKLF
jgi:hypothetical protein